MNQSSKAPRTKATSTGAATTKSKKKSRIELDVEARERKRLKKHSGHAAGSRSNVDANKKKDSQQRKDIDPRIGSKKPVPLTVEPVAAKIKAVKNKPLAPAEKPPISPEEELALLENDPRLDALLDKLDDGVTLNAEDQAFVDQTLDRIDILMEMLGIELGDEDDEVDEKNEDMLQLLKRGNPQDGR